jgi:hypothetical protein
MASGIEEMAPFVFTDGHSHLPSPPPVDALAALE